ncbi:MAG: hypothetical protein M3Y75_13755 [Actinomycetota bacterium]|nr:hypothetical protein [Actinomycetota bacterium]
MAMAAAAALLLSYGSGLTYFQDSWEFLMHRRDFTVDTVFTPHSEHIVVIPVLIELVSLRLFGMESMTPDLVVLVALLLGAAACLFVYVRRRLGPWPALLMTTLLLFLGPAWQDLLWPFQIGYAGGILCGLAALLALENEDRHWDLAACALLTLATAFSSLGIPFAVGAAVQILLQRRQLGLRRLYVVVVPLLLYAAWYLGWGHESPNQLSAANVFDSPGYVGEGIVASLDALLALGTIADETVARSRWGLPLLIVLLALVAYGQLRRPGFPRGLWPALAAGATFWFLAAFNESLGREPYSSRYLYIGVFFLLLVAANLLQGVRLNRWGLIVAGALTAVVVGFNLVPLREGRDFFEKQTVLTRADLAAIEIAAPRVDPGFRLPPEISGTLFLNEIEAGEYLQAVGEYGSPAYSPAELAAAPEEGRMHADLVLANALPLNIETTAGAADRAGRCIEVAGGGQAPLALRPGVTTILLGPGGTGKVSLRRFARDEYPLVSEGIAPRSTTRLEIPPDRSDRPWQLLVEAPGTATVCRG